MFYLLINGQKSGPYQVQDVQQLIRQNAIGFETQFWRDGMMTWETIGSQRHLFENSSGQPQMYQQPPFQPWPHNYQPQPLVFQPAGYVSSKSRITYILLGLFLGGLGIHNFYAGYTSKAVAQLLMSLLLFWTIIVPLIVWVWIIIEVCTVDHDAVGNRMM